MRGDVMNIVEEMREILVPRGTADIIRLNIGGDVGFYSGQFVRDCIDCLEKRLVECYILEDKPNPLETLALQVLMASAYIDREDLKKDYKYVIPKDIKDD
jgi:hypothetical protein